MRFIQMKKYIYVKCEQRKLYYSLITTMLNSLCTNLNITYPFILKDAGRAFDTVFPKD